MNIIGTINFFFRKFLKEADKNIKESCRLKNQREFFSSKKVQPNF